MTDQLPAWPRIMPAGDSALVVEFGDRIAPEINEQVNRLAARLRDYPVTGLGEAVPTYRSLFIHYDPFILSYAQLADLVRDQLIRVESLPAVQPKEVEIPVVYGGPAGPDLEAVAALLKLRPDDVIRLHSEALYRVYMIGFTPGFPYLGGLPEQLVVPRLTTPRTHVPAGSVGIAANQAGIYPIESPGGWRILGRTALRLFDPLSEPPSLLAPGDLVRFVPVSGEG